MGAPCSRKLFRLFMKLTQSRIRSRWRAIEDCVSTRSRLFTQLFSSHGLGQTRRLFQMQPSQLSALRLVSSIALCLQSVDSFGSTRQTSKQTLPTTGGFRRPRTACIPHAGRSDAYKLDLRHHEQQLYHLLLHAAKSPRSSITYAMPPDILAAKFLPVEPSTITRPPVAEPAT